MVPCCQAASNKGQCSFSSNEFIKSKLCSFIRNIDKIVPTFIKLSRQKALEEMDVVLEEKDNI